MRLFIIKSFFIFKTKKKVFKQTKVVSNILNEIVFIFLFSFLKLECLKQTEINCFIYFK